MTRAELARMLDHSVLKPEATRDDVLEGARVVRKWTIGQYCVQPGWVRAACEALEGSGALVASVIGFPHGCEPGEVKARAAEIAVRDGAREVDMVIQLGRLKDGDADAVAGDIRAVVRAVPGIGVKASGGIRTLADARAMLASGANRLGTSASAAILADLP